MLNYKKILCALDFDNYEDVIFLLGAALARETDATLYLLHIAEVPTADMDVPLPFNSDPKWESEARLRLQKIVQQHPEAAGRYEVHVKSGVPDIDIAAEANRLEVDLIVIATHARRGFSHLLLGSVAERVVRDADCPVLVVRPPKPGYPVASSG